MLLLWVSVGLFNGASSAAPVQPKTGGATNYWGRIVEKRRPEETDYSEAIARAIRQEQEARAKKKELRVELQAVQKAVPVKAEKAVRAKPWVDPTKELRQRIQEQDALIKQAREDELRLRLQKLHAERQEQEDILVLMLAL
jgi:hypothetical protein